MLAELLAIKTADLAMKSDSHLCLRDLSDVTGVITGTTVDGIFVVGVTYTPDPDSGYLTCTVMHLFNQDGTTIDAAQASSDFVRNLVRKKLINSRKASRSSLLLGRISETQCRAFSWGDLAH